MILWFLSSVLTFELMMWFSCVSILVLLLETLTGGSEPVNRINVGTVLFTDSDNTKECWNSENVALLTSRMLLEDILPAKEVLVIKENGFVTDVIEYFRLVLDVIRKLTYGKAKHIVLLAATDILGGYLNRFVLPIVKRAYYAGFIDYDSVEKLYQLFDEIKCFLRTNGQGWVKPIKDFDQKLQPRPLPVQSPAPQTNPCRGLIFFEKSADDGPGKNRTITIPMPFFDSKIRPSSIALPFRTYSLRNIESKAASYVLVKFYMAATKCLVARDVNTKSVAEFNGNVLAFLHSQVLPRLGDVKFYSAFGGVLRIEETLKKLGVTQVNNKEIGNYNIMPEMQMKDLATELPEEQCDKRKKTNLILMALLATIFIWFLLGSLFICYRIRANKMNKDYKKISKSYSTSRSGLSKTTSKSSNKHTSSSGHKKSSSSTRSKKTSTSSTSNLSNPSASEIGRVSQKSLLAVTNQKPSTKRGSDTESSYSRSSKKSQRPPQLSKQSSKSGSSKKVTVYPTSCICNSGMPGKYRPTSSSEKVEGVEKMPTIYGYESETSSSYTSTPREPSKEILDAAAAAAGVENMSK